MLSFNSFANMFFTGCSVYEDICGVHTLLCFLELSSQQNNFIMIGNTIFFTTNLHCKSRVEIIALITKMMCIFIICCGGESVLAVKTSISANHETEFDMCSIMTTTNCVCHVMMIILWLARLVNQRTAKRYELRPP